MKKVSFCFPDSNNFSRFGNKKGLSTVVATLVIILLILVAIGVIWAVISNLIESGAEQVELNSMCAEVGFESVVVAEINGQNGNYSVTLERSSSGEEIGGAKVAFFNDSGDSSGPLEFGESLGPLEQEQRVIDTSQGDLVTNANRFDLTPYFFDENGNERLCPRIYSYNLGSSGTSLVGGGGGQGDPGTGFCGDGIIQSPNGEDPAINEECDGSDLGGQTCAGLGFESGSLGCTASCQYDTSSCVSATPDSCDGVWNQTDIDDGNECDGGPNCETDCTCPAGFTADGSGGCTLNPPVNEGVIFSVWPESGDANRFQSEDLPKNQSELTNYTTYSVNFSSSSETRCFGISSALYYGDINRSELGLNIPVGVSLANITSGQGYSVWEAELCGQ